MKHIFIVNPIAGKGDCKTFIIPKIEIACKSAKVDYEIYITKASGDAIKYVKDRASSGENLRFYACGGDGTLFEIVNGAVGFSNVEIAIIPLGSGNDFIRIFGTKETFLNIIAQFEGTVVDLDVIKCGDKYAINQCSVGLDGEICAKQAYFKKFISGESSYMASLLYCFFKKVKSTFTVTIDDDPPFTKDVLFAVSGNSRWYGGGFKGTPLAIPDDGLIDFVIVEKDFNRLKMLTLINKYKEGQHLEWDRTIFKRGKKMTIKSKKLAAINIDGECEYAYEATFEIVEKGVRFVIPSTSNYLKDKENGKISQNC